jgi:hypothetical protein
MKKIAFHSGSVHMMEVVEVVGNSSRTATHLMYINNLFNNSY